MYKCKMVDYADEFISCVQVISPIVRLPFLFNSYPSVVFLRGQIEAVLLTFINLLQVIQKSKVVVRKLEQTTW